MAGTRYIRYIAFAIFCLTLVFFISSSSTTGHISEQIQSTTKGFTDKWRDRTSPPQQTFDIDDELQKVPPVNEQPDDQDVSQKDITHPPPSQKNPPKKTPHKGNHAGRMNATFVTLARNSDLEDLIASINEVEDRFNRNYNYDWVFLNDEDFDEEFQEIVSNRVSGRARFGRIPQRHWSFPEWIDQKKAARVREEMKKAEIIYGDSISYRHMCRFESGFFFQQPLMLEYEYYWRVEPGIRLYCDINYDVFKFMADNDKKYSFVLTLLEYAETIPTLWDSVKKFMDNHPEHMPEDHLLDFVSEDDGNTYNRCHFWSNFEIGSLTWLRDQPYQDFFNHLDQEGGFFYERWGDAPVHSIAAALLLNKSQIHFFEDIGYYHVPFHHCPREEIWKKQKCRCNPSENFDWNGSSCLARYYELHGWDHPAQT